MLRRFRNTVRDKAWWLGCGALIIKRRLWPDARHDWHALRGDHEVHLMWIPERRLWRLGYRVGQMVHSDTKPNLAYFVEGVEQFIAQEAQDEAPDAQVRNLF